MTSHIDDFRMLHSQAKPLLLGNAWNVQSAQILEKVGFAAVATSSAAIARTLGYQDGEDMPFEDYLFIIKRMKKAIQVPFSVDLEAGYGATPAQVIDNITQLYDLGVVGINLEDTWVADGVRHLQNTGVFVNKLARITEGLAAKNIDMFINVRTDVFLLRMPNALEESLHRIEAYQAHKIDGIFLPFAIHEHDIRIVLEQLRVPLNLLCVHDLPSYENLHQWGVKRISMGSLFNAQAYKSLEKTADEVINAQDFTMLFQ